MNGFTALVASILLTTALISCEAPQTPNTATAATAAVAPVAEAATAIAPVAAAPARIASEGTTSAPALATTTVSAVTASTTVSTTPAATPTTAASTTTPRTLRDYQQSLGKACQSDADCVVKNVGSCCGYSPQCVHKDAQTFPEQVKELCEKEGRSSVCGFQEPAGCSCINNQCRNSAGAGI